MKKILLLATLIVGALPGSVRADTPPLKPTQLTGRNLAAFPQYKFWLVILAPARAQVGIAQQIRTPRRTCTGEPSATKAERGCCSSASPKGAP